MQTKIYIIIVTVLLCVSCGNKQNNTESDTKEIESVFDESAEKEINLAELGIDSLMLNNGRVNKIINHSNFEKSGIDISKIHIYEEEIELVFSDDMDIYNTPSEYFDSLLMTNKDSFLGVYGILDILDGVGTVHRKEAEKDLFRLHRVEEYMDYDYSIYGLCYSGNFVTNSYLKLIHKYYNRLLLEVDDREKKVLIKSQNIWLQSHELDKEFALSIYEPFEHGAWFRVHNCCSTLDKCRERFYFIFRMLNDYESMK